MSESDLYTELAERHGHYCPMSTLGLRLGQTALQRLQEPEGWTFYYFVRTCAIDGITLAMEIDGMKSELIVDQQGQHLLCCRNVNGKELSVNLTQEALQLAKDYQQLDDAGKQRQLDLLRSMPVEQLIDVEALNV